MDYISMDHMILDQRYCYLYVLGINPSDIEHIISTTTVRLKE